MPRYHLHQHTGGKVIPDEEGVDLASLDDAIGEAAQAAREIMADRLRRAEPADGAEFRIVSETGNLLATVQFEDILAGKPFPKAPVRNANK
jgi:hypothetical protein